MASLANLVTLITISKLQPELVPEDLREDLSTYSSSLGGILNESGRNYDWKKQRDVFQKSWIKLARGSKKIDSFLEKVNAVFGPENSLPKIIEVTAKSTQKKVEAEPIEPEVFEDEEDVKLDGKPQEETKDEEKKESD